MFGVIDGLSWGMNNWLVFLGNDCYVGCIERFQGRRKLLQVIGSGNVTAIEGDVGDGGRSLCGGGGDVIRRPIRQS